MESKGVLLKGAPVYLDTQATTPLDPRVLDYMLPFMTDMYGNPHSRTHLFGWETEDAVEKAREQVASLIGANAKEIIFTSGATESNNLAIKGVAGFYKEKKRHVITTQTDHKCVLDSCRVLQQRGFDVTYLPVDTDGLIDLEELKAAIRDDTALVSVMAVNNEIGVIQPLKEIGAICRERGVFFQGRGRRGRGRGRVGGRFPVPGQKFGASADTGVSVADVQVARVVGGAPDARPAAAGRCVRAVGGHVQGRIAARVGASVPIGDALLPDVD